MALWPRPRLPRRGVLPSTLPSLASLVTGRVIARVWLAAVLIGAAGWLVAHGSRAVTATGLLPAPDARGVGLLAAAVALAGYLGLRLVSPAAAQAKSLVLLSFLGLAALGMAHAGLRASVAVWLVPMAAPAMLAALLLTPAAAVVTATIAALLVGLMAGQQLGVSLVLWLGGIAGAMTVQGARRRGHLLRAGCWSGVVQGTAIAALQVMEQHGPRDALWSGLVGGAVSGAAAFAVTITLLPVLENLFGLITDITLLELSDLNHPLLRELSLKAPGTYHHSLIVATLAEAGCEAIGANGLLARVGCYFHDIGKLPKAEYFVENQPPGQSRHDTLAPSMSALIIINHVKEGVELARRYRLSQAIIDFIPGHHGTGLIYYFYRRALEQVEDERLLKEEGFRYPGPRPRRRETAVAMLADSVEAACRALPSRTPAKLLGVTRRIVNNKFIDGQLDECDLTLRDLERIAAAFVRVLSGIYHARVPYPAPPGEDVEDYELEASLDQQLPGFPRAPGRPPAAGPAGLGGAGRPE